MPKDILGREVDAPGKELLESLKLGKAKPFKTTIKDEDSDSSMSSDLAKKFELLANLIKTFMGGKKTGKAAQNEKISVNADKALQTMVKHATKKGSLYTHDVYLEKAARVNNLELKAMRLEMKRGKSNDDRQMLVAV